MLRLVAITVVVCATPATAFGPASALEPPRNGAKVSDAPVQERVKFDFAWRFNYNDGNFTPPPTPPPVPPTHCPNPDAFPANASGMQCSGLTSDKAETAEACGIACCNDQLCADWQFSNASTGGGCWMGMCHGPMKQDDKWVGGTRSRRAPQPIPPPPPPPDPSAPPPPEARPGFDDSTWKSIDVPHDMNVDGAASLEDCPSGCSGRSYLRRHTGWYRKMFTVPADWKGEHISVEFEGVFHYSMIYLNGVLLTNHSCGYTSFDVELPAKLLNYGQPNTFAVYTDATSGTGWWYEGGGIFRHVWLVKRSPIHFATWGVFVAPSVHPGTVRSAVARGATIAAASPSGGELVGTVTLNVTATVVSTESAAAATVGAAIDVFDAVGSHVGSFSTENVSVVSGGEVSLHSLRPLPAEVNLWTIRAPALYTVRTRLLTTSGAVLDEVNTTTGFRLLRYDSSNGFQMNGEEVKVRGFCDHNDFGSVGTAVPDRINLYRAQAARSLGGNGRRTSHNPPNPSMLDIYDRVGMVVMAENRDFFAGDRYYENMADLVRRDRNHASVTIWSFCNEGACSAAGSAAEAGEGFRQVSYEFDGTRPVLGNMVGDQPEGPLSNLTDVQGFSHAGRSTLATYHETYPNKPLFLSECCSCNTQRGENWGTESVNPAFNADCLASQTNASQAVPWVAGAMVWTLFDYYGEPSFGGWPHVSSTFGSFDLAGFAKAGVYWYRSFWLLQVPDSAADKPFPTAGQHIVRIVENWDPAATPVYPSNTTDVETCSSQLSDQHITFSGVGANSTGQLKDQTGLCIDGTCGNMSLGKCTSLLFVPCSPSSAAQQWRYNENKQFVCAANGGCMNVWSGGVGPGIGLWSCTRGGAPNDQWDRTDQGFKTLASASANHDRCMSNGVSNSKMDIHVYTDLASVELFINGVSVGTQSIVNPGVTPTADAQSWAEFTGIAFVPGNLTAVGRDGSGGSVTTHVVHTSGTAASIVLSLDAPSPLSGTGAALFLDGQDAGLVRATIVDAAGRLVSTASHNVTFEIVSGPGRIVGAQNGDPQCHEPNQVAWHSAYHGLVRAVVMVTQDTSSPSWHRQRLHEIDIDAGARTRIVLEGSVATPIVLRASTPGLPSVTIQINTSADESMSVMSVAEASAGKPVVIN